MSDSHFEVQTITITLTLDEDGDPHLSISRSNDGREELVTVLGMLELARDTLVRDAMGEVPDDAAEDS